MIPIIVHKWFKKGEGWAYHPSLQGRLVSIIKAITPLINRGRAAINGGKAFEIDQIIGETRYLGYIVQDNDCQFAASADRAPFVLKLACVSSAIDDSQKAKLLAILSTTDANQEGRSDDLAVDSEQLEEIVETPIEISGAVPGNVPPFPPLQNQYTPGQQAFSQTIPAQPRTSRKTIPLNHRWLGFFAFAFSVLWLFCRVIVGQILDFQLTEVEAFLFESISDASIALVLIIAFGIWFSDFWSNLGRSEQKHQLIGLQQILAMSFALISAAIQSLLILLRPFQNFNDTEETVFDIAVMVLLVPLLFLNCRSERKY